MKISRIILLIVAAVLFSSCGEIVTSSSISNYQRKNLQAFSRNKVKKKVSPRRVGSVNHPAVRKEERRVLIQRSTFNQ